MATRKKKEKAKILAYVLVRPRMWDAIWGETPAACYVYGVTLDLSVARAWCKGGGQVLKTQLDEVLKENARGVSVG